MSSDRVEQQVGQWRDELIDLTRRNRLLNLNTTNKTSVLTIIEPGYEAILANLHLRTGWRFHYPPLDEDESNDAALVAAIDSEDTELTATREEDELLTDTQRSRDLSRILRNLERRGAQEYLDKGLRVLYLACGMLEWTDESGAAWSSPLVLVPVSLVRPNPRAPFRLVGTDDDAVVNPALAVKLESDYEVVAPTIGEDLDVSSLLESFRSLVGTRSTWRVTDTVLLSFFSFQKEVMYQDLKENAEVICQHPVVQALALGPAAGTDLGFEPPNPDQLDESAPPEKMVSILDADSTQRQCIAAARDGKSFVMDGPPGSGKSQTIANMIAEFIAAGKTALFVSEKAAALEVVKSRLDRAGLGSYVLELHSHKATRKEVARALDAAVRERPVPGPPLSASEMAGAEHRRRELSAYAAALNEVRAPLERSLHWALGRCAQLDDLPKAPLPEGIQADLSAATLAQIIDGARSIASAWGPVSRGNAFLWRDLLDPFATLRRQAELARTLSDLDAALGALGEHAGTDALDLGLDAPRDFEATRRLVVIEEFLAASDGVPESWLTVETFDSITDRRFDRERDTGRINALRSSLDHACSGWTELPTDAAANLQVTLEAFGTLAPDARPKDDETLTALAGTTEFLQSAPESIRQSREDATKLAHAFGPADIALDFRTAQHLAAAAQLASSAHRPEASWFDSQTVLGVRDAVGVLRPIIEEHRRIGYQLSALFKPELRDFDVESLFESEQDPSPKLGRLSSRGRANRKALAAFTSGGEVTSEVIAALPTVRVWQRVARQLREAEVGRWELLGAHYYQGPATDFDAVDSALNVAEQTLRLIGPAGDSKKLGSALGRGSLDLEDTAATGARLADRLSSLAGQLDEHLGDHSDALVPRSLDELAEWCAAAARLYERLSSALDRIAQLGCIHSELGRIVGVATDRSQVALAEESLRATRDADLVMLGSRYLGVATDWPALRAALEQVVEPRSLLGGPVSERTARRFVTWTGDPAPLSAELDRVAKLWTNVLAEFALQRAEELRQDAAHSLADARDVIQELHSTMADIEEWGSFCRAREELVAYGLGAVVEFGELERIDAANVASTTERATLAAWSEAVMRDDSDRLGSTRPEERDRLVREFRLLDRKMVNQAASLVMVAGNARRPASTAGAAGIIAKEAQKKRKHMPIRTLLAKTGPVAQDCKPCFMMSPLSVSSFLPADLHFDVVIFDEASQVRPCDSINAVYRGDELIVAGDEKQLPPTSFFDRLSQSAGGDEYEEEQLDEFESVLDLCRSGSLEQLGLRWHYRSRHESLISYSNYSFYKGQLVTYPGAAEVDPDLGVEFFHVPEGVYQRGAARDNPIEARRVVERVLHHATRNPDSTLGVIAFSEAQASRISYELDAARRARPELDDFFTEDRLDGFFIKNLESVQGDERDTILFSIGYGRDEVGKFTLNFGPVIKAGGWRRLNVAATRARRRVEVISSIVAGDIGDTSNLGVGFLKRYLDYAARGMNALAVPVSDENRDVESPFEEEVLATIRSCGYDAVPQVGQAGYRIDIGVRHPTQPGRYALGVECDGAAYHSSRVARDRDRLRQEVLEGLDWQLHRIWGPAWYRNRAAEEDRLRTTIDDAIAGRRKPPIDAPAARVHTMQPEVELVDFDSPPSWTTPYVVSSPATSHHGDITDSTAGPEIDRIVLQVVQTEGPIAWELCSQRVRAAFGQARLGARIRHAITMRINQMVRRAELVEIEEGFLVVPGTVASGIRVPDPDDPATRRPPGQVSWYELREAILRIVKDAHTIDEEPLSLQVARLFRWSRTADTRAAIEQVIDGLVEGGQLVRNGAGLTINGR